MFAVMNFTIYRRDMQLDKNDRLMFVHTSIYFGDAWWKIITFTCSNMEIAGLNKRKKKKIIKSGKIISLK